MIFGSKFNFLIPDKEQVDRLVIDSKYVRNNGSRRIFKNVNFDSQEREKLNEFKKALDSIPVEYDKNCQSDSVLLRFLYANNFDIHYSVQHFTDYLEIMWELNVREYPVEIDEYNNLVEIVGRDEMLRPIIYINLALLKDTDDPLIILRNIMIHLVIMEEYMFVPGKIETWIAILNPNTTALHILNIDQIIYCAKMIQISFPKCLEYLYIIDAPVEVKLIYDKVRESSEVISQELEFKIVFYSKKELESMNFSYFNWAQVHKQTLKKEEQIQAGYGKADLTAQHHHGFGEWDDCELCKRRNLRLQNLKKNNEEENKSQLLIGQQQSQQQNSSQQQNQYQQQHQQHPYPSQSKQGELVGPLYPMVVYAVGPPVSYDPQAHDDLLTKQKPIPNTYFLDNNKVIQPLQPQQNLQVQKLKANQESIRLNNNQISQFNQSYQQEQRKTQPLRQTNHQISEQYMGRTKYDDLIDEYGWDKYGQQQMQQSNNTLKNNVPQIKIIKTDETIKNPTTYPNYETPQLQTYSSTPSKQFEIYKQDEFSPYKPLNYSYKPLDLNEYRPSDLKEYKADLQEYRPSDFKEYKASDLQEYKVQGIQEYRPSDFKEYKASDLQEYKLQNLDDHSSYQPYKTYQPYDFNKYDLSKPTEINIKTQDYTSYKVNEISQNEGQKPTQFIPQMIEKDGIKHQDETFIVGDQSRYPQRKIGTNNDVQCNIF